jgi:hypothetical protein
MQAGIGMIVSGIAAKSDTETGQEEPTPKCPHAGGPVAIPGDHAAAWDLAVQADLLYSPVADSGSLQDQARLAWRNSVRCIGRLHWKSLQVRDERSLEDPGQIFEALLNLKRKMEIWSSRAKYCNYGEWMPQSRRFLFTQKVS